MALTEPVVFSAPLPTNRPLPVAVIDRRRAAAAGASSLVLVVEDDPATRDITTRILERFGYRVLSAENGAVAIRLYREHGLEIALVLTDMSMPVLDGPATMEALMQLNPDTKIIACSGTNCRPLVLRRGRAEPVPFLQKPFAAEELVALIRGLLADPTNLSV